MLVLLRITWQHTKLSLHGDIKLYNTTYFMQYRPVWYLPEGLGGLNAPLETADSPTVTEKRC